MSEEQESLSEECIVALSSEQECWNFSEWNGPNDSTNNYSSIESSSPSCDSSEDSSEAALETQDSPAKHLNSIDNEYIRGILSTVDLKILQESQVNNAFNSNDRELELFHLFMSKNYLDVVSKWTNEVLLDKGRKQCSCKEFLAYIGLELGMSLMKFNDIKKYWARGSFLGHETFRSTMSRSRFQDIRSCVRFSSKQSYDSDGASTDPLWFCRSLIDQFIRKSASVAVPLGVSALDENSCPTKARTRAKTYSPNKPAKYAIRFYAVVGHKYCYLSSMFDNRAGNTTGIAGIHDYCRLFRTLHTPYNNVIGNDKGKDSLAGTPSALWITMMGHQSAIYKQPNGGKRYFFCDNYYTRHAIANALTKFTDGEARVIGTVKFTNVDGTNRYYLSKAIELMKDQSRGSWALVQAYNKHPNYDQLRSQHASQQRRVRSASDRAAFVPPLDSNADRAGFIVFKDSKVVLFYSNDLCENPEEPILLGTDERAIRCVGGLAKISRWTGTENLHRTDFFVAAPIVAYNMFMNGVDRMDQYCATLAAQRREKRVHKTMFTFILDLSITQAYAVYQKMSSEKELPVMSYFNFKRTVCHSLILPWMNGRGRNANEVNIGATDGVGQNVVNNGRVTIASSLGVINETHMLVENLPRKTGNGKPQDIDCYLCRKMGKEMKTIYSCIQCRKGFHVNCFTAFHYRGVLSRKHNALLDVVFNSDVQPTVGNPSKYAPTSTDHMLLPAEKESMFTRALIRTKGNATANAKRKLDNEGIRKQRKEQRLQQRVTNL